MQHNVTYTNPEQLINLNWRVRSLKIFVKALSKYSTLLRPYNTSGNDKIKEEISKINKLTSHFREIIHRGMGDFDFMSMTLMASTCGWLSDILHKYWRSLEAQLNDKKKMNFVEGALEAEEKEIEEIREILQNNFWSQIDSLRIRTLVPDFIEKEVIDGNIMRNQNLIKQQITIGNLYGQAVFGENSGSMVQNNKKELLETL